MPILPGTGEIIILIVLLIVAVFVILLLRAIFMLLPAAIVAGVVWFLTGSLTWAGVAFLAIAILSILRRH